MNVLVDACSVHIPSCQNLWPELPNVLSRQAKSNVRVSSTNLFNTTATAVLSCFAQIETKQNELC